MTARVKGSEALPEDNRNLWKKVMLFRVGH